MQGYAASSQKRENRDLTLKKTDFSGMVPVHKDTFAPNPSSVSALGNMLQNTKNFTIAVSATILRHQEH